MSRIVTSTYRYKRPPRKRAKAAAIEGPVIVRAKKPGPRKAGAAPAPELPATPPATDSLPRAERRDRKAAIKVASSDLEREPGRTSAQAAPKPALASPARHVARKPQAAGRASNSSGSAATQVNDDRKSAIVTARRPGKRRYADVPEMTEEEHKRRGDAADALFQQIKREIAEKVRKP